MSELGSVFVVAVERDNTNSSVETLAYLIKRFIDRSVGINPDYHSDPEERREQILCTVGEAPDVTKIHHNMEETFFAFIFENINLAAKCFEDLAKAYAEKPNKIFLSVVEERPENTL